MSIRRIILGNGARDWGSGKETRRALLEIAQKRGTEDKLNSLGEFADNQAR